MDKNRKFEAVIFDLGGTLVRNVGWTEYEKVAKEVALLIAAPVEDFTRHWFAESHRLGIGDFDTYSEYICHVCSCLDIKASESALDRAEDILLDVSKRMIDDLHPGAVELLEYLKMNDYRIGLISDCFTDIPALWDQAPFSSLVDVAVFSCFEGMNKSDTRIFRRAVDRLEVNPEQCVYVADGMRNELTNAAGLGMYAVRLHIPEEREDSPIQEDWNGPDIFSLGELLNVFEGEKDTDTFIE